MQADEKAVGYLANATLDLRHTCRESAPEAIDPIRVDALAELALRAAGSHAS